MLIHFSADSSYVWSETPLTCPESKIIWKIVDAVLKMALVMVLVWLIDIMFFIIHDTWHVSVHRIWLSMDCWSIYWYAVCSVTVIKQAVWMCGLLCNCAGWYEQNLSTTTHSHWKCYYKMLILLENSLTTQRVNWSIFFVVTAAKVEWREWQCEEKRRRSDGRCCWKEYQGWLLYSNNHSQNLIHFLKSLGGIWRWGRAVLGGKSWLLLAARGASRWWVGDMKGNEMLASVTIHIRGGKALYWKFFGSYTWTYLLQNFLTLDSG